MAASASFTRPTVGTKAKHSGPVDEPSPADQSDAATPPRQESAEKKSGVSMIDDVGISLEMGESTGDGKGPTNLTSDRSERCSSRDTVLDRPQFAEFDPHAAPEAVNPAAIGEAKTPSDLGHALDTASGRALPHQNIQDGFPTRLIGQPVVEDEGSLAAERRDKTHRSSRAILCQPWQLARRKPYLAAAAVSLVLGVLVLVILPIVLHSMSLDGATK